MVQESRLGVENLIFPIFLKDGVNIQEPIHSLPNIYRWSVDLLLKKLDECLKLGIRALIFSLQ